ncbi:biopolymer transporter ExbD [bacterium]|nr:biopolymer transporter ExbD [bacterium]
MESRWRPSFGGDINLAPLLDVIFCLLFFFILATSIRQQREAIEVALPRTEQSAQRIQPPDRLEVWITRENEILFEDRKVTPDELAVALEKARAQHREPDSQVIIRTDGRADVQTFVNVSDACARAGLEAALMETRPDTETPPNP